MRIGDDLPFHVNCRFTHRPICYCIPGTPVELRDPDAAKTYYEKAQLLQQFWERPAEALFTKDDAVDLLIPQNSAPQPPQGLLETNPPPPASSPEEAAARQRLEAARKKATYSTMTAASLAARGGLLYTPPEGVDVRDFMAHLKVQDHMALEATAAEILRIRGMQVSEPASATEGGRDVSGVGRQSSAPQAPTSISGRRQQEEGDNVTQSNARRQRQPSKFQQEHIAELQQQQQQQEKFDIMRRIRDQQLLKQQQEQLQFQQQQAELMSAVLQTSQPILISQTNAAAAAVGPSRPPQFTPMSTSVPLPTGPSFPKEFRRGSRKRAPPKAWRLQPQHISHGLSGKLVQVLWPEDKKWWPALVLSVDPGSGTAVLLYEAGEKEETVALRDFISKENVAWLNAESAAHYGGGHAAATPAASPAASGRKRSQPDTGAAAAAAAAMAAGYDTNRSRMTSGLGLGSSMGVSAAGGGGASAGRGRLESLDGLDPEDAIDREELVLTNLKGVTKRQRAAAAKQAAAAAAAAAAAGPRIASPEVSGSGLSGSDPPLLQTSDFPFIDDTLGLFPRQNPREVSPFAVGNMPSTLQGFPLGHVTTGGMAMPPQQAQQLDSYPLVRQSARQSGGMQQIPNPQTQQFGMQQVPVSQLGMQPQNGRSNIGISQMDFPPQREQQQQQPQQPQQQQQQQQQVPQQQLPPNQPPHTDSPVMPHLLQLGPNMAGLAVCLHINGVALPGTVVEVRPAQSAVIIEVRRRSVVLRAQDEGVRYSLSVGTN